MATDSLLDIYLDEVSCFPVLNREEEAALGRRVRRGDRSARQEMIQANLRLVVSVARQYEHLGLPILDIIEEGNIGLMRAVERFDPAMEFRFSTYAVHWIRQGIRRALAEKGRSIRLPAYMADLVSRLRRHGINGCDHENIDEMARILRLDPSKVGLIERVVATAAQAVGPVDPLILAEAGELLTDGSPEESMVSGEDTFVVRERLERLPAREAEVLRHRFGLDGCPVLTLEEIGESFELTSERIRQIEAEALGRLRSMISAEAVL
jgi:RNA polymerase primary sigma factor